MNVLDWVKKHNKFNKSQILNWLVKHDCNYHINYYEIKNINNQLVVNCSGDIRLVNILSFPFKFGIIRGDFNFKDNKIKSLKNSPYSVLGDFCATNNHLTSLEFFPEIISGSVFLAQNKIKSLSGLPKIINHDLIVHSNKINTLKGGPEKIYGHFICANNLLINLENCPYIGRGASFAHNKLMKLNHNIDYVGGVLDLRLNNNLDISPNIYINFNEMLMLTCKDKFNIIEIFKDRYKYSTVDNIYYLNLSKDVYEVILKREKINNLLIDNKKQGKKIKI